MRVEDLTGRSVFALARSKNGVDFELEDSPVMAPCKGPDCFGEYNKKNKLCSTYCSISIRCCVMRAKNPKIDIFENQ